MTLVVTILALGILGSLSPSALVVFILLLATTRARVNAVAFLVGWGLSLAVVFALSYTAGSADILKRSGGRAMVDALEILLGMTLALLAVRQWRLRHRPRSPSALSRQLTRRLKDLEPWQAIFVGVFAQPWALTAAAAVVVVHYQSAFVVVLAAFAVFTVASTTTVAVTFAYYSREPGEATAQLDGLRQRLVQAGPILAAAVLLVVGLYLIANGAVALA
jgi:hypothetical protein